MPAYNEAGTIGGCFRALAAGATGAARLEVRGPRNKHMASNVNLCFNADDQTYTSSISCFLFFLFLFIFSFSFSNCAIYNRLKELNDY